MEEKFFLESVLENFRSSSSGEPVKAENVRHVVIYSRQSAIRAAHRPTSVPPKPPIMGHCTIRKTLERHSQSLKRLGTRNFMHEMPRTSMTTRPTWTVRGESIPTGRYKSGRAHPPARRLQKTD